MILFDPGVVISIQPGAGRNQAKTGLKNENNKQIYTTKSKLKRFRAHNCQKSRYGERTGKKYTMVRFSPTKITKVRIRQSGRT